MDADKDPGLWSSPHGSESASPAQPTPDVQDTTRPRQTWGQGPGPDQPQWWNLLASSSAGVTPQWGNAQPASSPQAINNPLDNLPPAQQPNSPHSYPPSNHFSTSFQYYPAFPPSSTPPHSHSSTSSTAVDPRTAFPSQHYQHNQHLSPIPPQFPTTSANDAFPPFGAHSGSPMNMNHYPQPFHPSTWTNLAVGHSASNPLDGYANTINPDSLTSTSPTALNNHDHLSGRRKLSDVKSHKSRRSSKTASSGSKTDSPGQGSGYEVTSQSLFATSPTMPNAHARRRKSQAAIDNEEEVRLRELEKDMAMAEFDAGPNRGNKRERRKMQNRLAQKTFRARTKVLAGEEAERVLTLESQRREQGEQIERMTALVDRLQQENRILRNAWPQMTSPNQTFPDRLSASSSGSPEELNNIVPDESAAGPSGSGLGLSTSPFDGLAGLASSPTAANALPDRDSPMDE